MKDLENFSRLLLRLTEPFLRLSAEQVKQLHEHFLLLQLWNRVMNLTRIATMEQAVERHYAESLFLAAHLPLGLRGVADIGSGAGFPGIPVAVAHAELRVWLVESDLRKAAFLREASDLCSNVCVQAIRGEALAEPVEFLIARAVRPSEVIRLAKRIGAGYALLLSEDDALSLKSDQVRITRLPFGAGSLVISRTHD